MAGFDAALPLLADVAADFSADALPLPFASTGFKAGEARAEGVFRTRLALPLAEGCGGARKVSSVMSTGIDGGAICEWSDCGRSAGLFWRDERADDVGSKCCGTWTASSEGDSDERPFMSKSEAKFMNDAGVIGLSEVEDGAGGGPIDPSVPACVVAACATVADSRRPGATRGWC